MNKIISYIGWLGHNNIGDEACFYEITRRLPKNVRVIPGDGNVSQQKGADLCILGGGTLLDLSYDRREHALLNFINSGIPVVVWGTGVLSITETKQKNTVNKKVLNILNRAKFVGVRGPLSKKTLDKNGFLGSKIIGDPGFVTPYSRVTLTKQSKNIAVNIGDTCSVLFGSEKHVLTEIEKLCELLHKNGFYVTLFGMWLNDYKILNKVTGADAIREWDPNVQNLLEFFGTCYCVVGEKLHSIVLSASAGVPFVALCYREKCFDFCHSIGLENWGVSTASVTLAEDVLERILILKTHYDIISNKIFNYKQAYNIEHDKLSNLVKEIIGA